MTPFRYGRSKTAAIVISDSLRKVLCISVTEFCQHRRTLDEMVGYAG